MEERYQIIAQLIVKDLQGTIKKAEKELLDNWIAESSENKNLYSRITSEEGYWEELKIFHEVCYAGVSEAGRKKIEKELNIHIPEVIKEPSFTLNWWQSAAAIVIVAVAAYFFWPDKGGKKTVNEDKLPISYIPSGNNPILKVSKDSSIELDILRSGIITQVGNSTIEKKGADSLVYSINKYELKETAENKSLYLNTLATPQNRQLYVTLSDGTQMLLKDSSAVTFPPDLTKNERTVELKKGNVTFDVAPNKSKPFRVKVYDNIFITAKGTRFSISAQSNDKKVKATLYEGVILISNKTNSVELQPGQQALTANDGPINVSNSSNASDSSPFNTEPISFNNDDFATVLKKLEKGYGVIAVYKIKLPGGTFTAGINQNTPLNDVILMLETRFHIHIELNGNKIIVLP
jgi:transmembrane sensor